MKIRELFNIKKIFSFIIDFKKYISFNLISLLGYLDLLYCIYFIATAIGPDRFSAGDILLIFTVYYSFFTRTLFLLFLILFVIEKSTNFYLKTNKFTENKIYNIFFLFGIVIFSIFSSIILYPLITILYAIIFAY